MLNIYYVLAILIVVILLIILLVIFVINTNSDDYQKIEQANIRISNNTNILENLIRGYKNE